MIRRMFDQTFHAAEAFGERKQLGALEKALGAGEIAVQFDRDDAAERRHLCLGERVLGMAFEAGVDHPAHVGTGFQPLGERESVDGVTFNSKRQVLRPRSARKLSKGPETAPVAFCRNASCSTSSGRSPTTTAPPTMSE